MAPVAREVGTWSVPWLHQRLSLSQLTLNYPKINVSSFRFSLGYRSDSTHGCVFIATLVILIRYT
jgi:hypothetical protein